MLCPCCADVSHKKFMHVGVHNCFCPPATEMLRQRARKKFMRLNFNGPLSSRCRVPGAPCPGLGSGRFGLVWAVICRQYLVYWPCLAMGAQIKADACWLLISSSCFTLIFCSKLVWVSGSDHGCIDKVYAGKVYVCFFAPKSSQYELPYQP